MKHWYIIQTYAGSELKVKEELERRVEELALGERFERFKVDHEETYFLAPVEEVITSKSQRGLSGEYRVPYNYELAIESNRRIRNGDLIAYKPPYYMEFDATVVSITPLQRVIIEMTNRNEEVYLIPADKHIRRDIRMGEKIRSGIPLTADKEFVAETKGKIALRDRVKKIELEKEDGEIVTKIIPERYLVRLHEGMRLKKGDLLEKEDRIVSRTSGLAKVKEYKDKQVVSVQKIEKRRLFPGYIFARMEMDEQMLKLVSGLKCRFVGSPPLPVPEREMKVVKRKAGLEEIPKQERPRVEVDFEVGEVVEIVEGPFADFTGEIREIDKENEQVTVMVRIFGRETPVQLGFEGIEKL
ncbi:MAG: transcription termination/antitermination NusG family protein [Candidatus Acetothermia bacterium]|nr:transcription termination/antitermination NusG family protein [Candidatus Acetothermia bacterium]